MDKIITTQPRVGYAYSSETGKHQNNHNSSKNPFKALGRRFKEAASQLTFKSENKTSSSPPIKKQIRDRAVSDPNLYKINSQVNLLPSLLGATSMTHHVPTPHHSSTPHLWKTNLSENQSPVLTSNPSLIQRSYIDIPTHTNSGNLNVQTHIPNRPSYHYSYKDISSRTIHEESKPARPNLKGYKSLFRSHNQLSQHPVIMIDRDIDRHLASGCSLEDFQHGIKLRQLDYRYSGEDKRAYAYHSKTITIERRCIETLSRITDILTSKTGKEIPIRNSVVNIEKIKDEIKKTLQHSKGIDMSYLDIPWDSKSDASRTVIISINENPTSPNMKPFKLGITNTEDGYIIFRADHLKEIIDKNLTKYITKKFASLDQLLNEEFVQFINPINNKKDVILSKLALFSSY